MKSLYFLVFITIASFNLSAQQAEKVKWYTLDEALKLNATAPRKILIDTYTDWCGWCKKMDAETFDHPVIAAYVNKNFYAVKFDAESSAPVQFAGHTFTNQGSGGSRKTTHQFVIALAQSAGLTQVSFPSIVYLTGDMKLIGMIPGFYTADNIEPLLHYIVNEKFMSISLEDYQKTFVSELKKK